ncbi:G-protein coupled bile acid receptor 1 [Gadus morhua]|uniref:G-protein coupled receptors family 1 profile domain-containing protein n=1 Tax=Gadus morhua TaxID=8049 RepID=A0A8C5C3C8_GADMO|nr:G-protein coupled bile acid receptor 1 [Gadus morhua]
MGQPFPFPNPPVGEQPPTVLPRLSRGEVSAMGMEPNRSAPSSRYPLLSAEQLIYAITVPLSTSIILANLLIILGIALNRKLHNTPNYFFLSLLVADLCTGVALPFIPWMGLNRQLSFSSCLVAHVFPNFLFLAFLLNLVMVHYERYTCIASPLHYSRLWVHRCFPLALLVVWVPPLLYAALPAFGWNNWSAPDWDYCCPTGVGGRMEERRAEAPCAANTTSSFCCSYRRVFPNAFIYLEVYGLVLPAILAIAGMTGRVLWITRGQLRDICRLHRSLERGAAASDREQRLQLRYARCVAAVSLTFLACWLPYVIYMHVCVAFLLSETRWSSTVHIVLSCTGVASMAVVPLVLGMANRQYTDPASRILLKLRARWRTRRPQHGEEIAL